MDQTIVPHKGEDDRTKVQNLVEGVSFYQVCSQDTGLTS